ncbi:MAG TPA: rRNA maturation RNase YbeY [Candidatus Cloacimonadota bacterium]|nr:rRNA maturation RNase YbeY [Candidatus Cloacimonadota bacterium]HOV15909.1 rRNA maturation RNase YbeY [Candidatus Cloacimonadota bacterium]HQL14296.1 rRNA maturation RNase YbeY [Candidatus Cloacimonadota bacterium]
MNKHPQVIITGEDPNILGKKELEELIRTSCELMGKETNVTVSLVYCDDNLMQTMNAKYRGVNKTTDVLSFPDEFAFSRFHLQSDDNIYLGEIIIDTNYALHEIQPEKWFDMLISIFIHGLVHLWGYDHLTTQQAKEMKLMEDAIRAEFEKEHNK